MSALAELRDSTNCLNFFCIELFIPVAITTVPGFMPVIRVSSPLASTSSTIPLIGRMASPPRKRRQADARIVRAEEAEAWPVRPQSRPFALSTSLNTSVAMRNASRQAGMPQ